LWLDTSGSDYTLKTWDGSAWREIVVTSAMIKDGAIVNADINASAAIAYTKLANITAGSVLLGNASNVPTATALSGDVTVSDAGVTAIGSGVIVDADIDASAAISGTKVSPDFGSQDVVTTGDVQSASINGGPLAGMRNAIINGNFDIWQRGTSFTGSDYGADRWSSSRFGSTHTVTRQAFTLGQTDVPGEPTFYHRTVVSSVAGAGNFSLLQQKLEDVRTFAGQQVTVSFWAKVDATKNISVEFAQSFGAGGSPSASVTGVDVAKVSIGTIWQKVTVTATIPSITAKTLGTDGNSFINLVIWFDAGSDFNSRTDTLGQQSGTFDIAQVQIEAGPVATPFERRPIGTELALCQRYFEIRPNTSTLVLAPGARSTHTSAAFVSYQYKQTKRTAPSVTATFANLSSLTITADDTNVRFSGTANTASVASVNSIVIDAEL
jgi:hypothetical protein